MASSKFTVQNLDELAMPDVFGHALTICKNKDLILQTCFHPAFGHVIEVVDMKGNILSKKVSEDINICLSSAIEYLRALP